MNEPIDRLAIIDVVNQVATAVDHGDWTACRAAFTDTIELDHASGNGADTVAANDLIDGWRRIWDGFSATFHAVTNHEVHLQGERARCRSHVQALHVAAGPVAGDNTYTTYGFYDDHLVRTPQGWKIKTRAYRQIFDTGNKDIFTNPSPHAGARNLATVHTYFRLQQEQDLDTWITLWADDGAQAIPYAPDGFPKLVTGRTRLDEIYRNLFAGYAKLTIIDPQIDALHDPNRVLARWHTHAELADGTTYDNDLVGLFEFDHDGKAPPAHRVLRPRPFRRHHLRINPRASPGAAHATNERWVPAPRRSRSARSPSTPARTPPRESATTAARAGPGDYRQPKSHQ